APVNQSAQDREDEGKHKYEPFRNAEIIQLSSIASSAPLSYNHITMSSSSTSSPNSSQATSTIGVTQIFQGQQIFNDTFESNDAIAPGEVASQLINGQQTFYGAIVNENSVITDNGNVDQDNVNSTFQRDFYDTGALESIVSLLLQGTTPNAPPAASSPAPIVPAASAAQIITGHQIFHQGISMTNTNVATGVTSSAQLITGDQVFNGPVVN
ncbi:hypothetical protein BDN70DRAFT_975471, partial [Pholiota conissans]